MPQHIIKNYEQVKAHLTRLSKDFNGTARDYYFAVGDLFNESIPPASSLGGQVDGMSSYEYQRRLSREIEQLLVVTETDITPASLPNIRAVARAWPKDDRHYACSFTVYKTLQAHQELIHDGMGMTEAREAVRAKKGIVRDGAAPEALKSRLHGDQRAFKDTYNRTQTMRIGINCLRGVGANDDGSPLSDEEVALLGEAYSVLDAYCERKGVSFYDEPAELVAA